MDVTWILFFIFLFAYGIWVKSQNAKYFKKLVNEVDAKYESVRKEAEVITASFGFKPGVFTKFSHKTKLGPYE